MNVRCIIVGAVTFFVVANIFGLFVSGPAIHEGVLDRIYQEHESFWKPELRQDPPDMTALMPIWLLQGAIFSLVFGWLYSLFRSCLAGGEWLRGLKFSLALGVFTCASLLAWSGLFDLPGTLWAWWCIDSLLTYSVAGVAMGWTVGRWGGVAA